MNRPYLRTVLCGALLTALVSHLAVSPGLQRATARELRCNVAPRSYANITSLLASPPLATPPATTAGETLEVGSPATEAEKQAMRNVVEEWLTCQNEGKLFSAWALFSNAYLYRLISRQPPLSEAVYDAWATPEALASATASLLEISGERQLADGRLGATVRISYASVPMPKQFFFYFVERNGSMLIDSILGEISFSVP
ncbi:MAG: hypothetical protein R2853_10635 [Thermomicrobiales bacterium]